MGIVDALLRDESPSAREALNTYLDAHEVTDWSQNSVAVAMAKRHRDVLQGIETNQGLTFQLAVLTMLERVLSGCKEELQALVVARKQALYAKSLEVSRRSSRGGRKNPLQTNGAKPSANLSLEEELEKYANRPDQHRQGGGYDDDDDSQLKQQLMEPRASGDDGGLAFERRSVNLISEEESYELERKMVEISSLLGTFAAKVEEQSETITSIHDLVCESQVNVEEGNEQLQKALDRGSTGAKVYVTFFLVAAASLLFLDWAQ